MRSPLARNRFAVVVAGLLGAACLSDPDLPVWVASSVPAEPPIVVEGRGSANEPRRDKKLRTFAGTDRPFLLREFLVHPGGRRVAHGREAEWYRDGQLRTERFYDHGEPSGVWRSWHADGTPSSVVHCDPETLGTTTWWHPNGRKSSEGPAVGGVKQGVWSSWHDNGVLASEGEYAFGRRQGPWREWDREGRLVASGTYREGVRVGEWSLGAPRDD